MNGDEITVTRVANGFIIQAAGGASKREDVFIAVDAGQLAQVVGIWGSRFNAKATGNGLGFAGASSPST